MKFVYDKNSLALKNLLISSNFVEKKMFTFFFSKPQLIKFKSIETDV